MAIPIQQFGSLLPTLTGEELLPLAAPDGSGNYIDRRATASAIASLAAPGNVVAIVAPNPRGDYNPAATYSQLDTVRYAVSGITSTYLHHALAPSTGIIPTDTSKWMVLARDGAGSSGGGGGLKPIRFSTITQPLALTGSDDPAQWIIPNGSNIVQMPFGGADFFYIINGGSGGDILLEDTSGSNQIAVPSGDGAFCWYDDSADQWLIQILSGTVASLTEGGGA